MKALERALRALRLEAMRGQREEPEEDGPSTTFPNDLVEPDRTDEHKFELPSERRRTKH